MERITYRITLDAHRTGIQRTLQGFETADKMARRIAVNLVASGDTFEMPMANVVAMMYVTTPNATEPSIHKCVIDGNTIIYDVEPIVEAGITEMQFKIMGTSTGGATNALISPRFAVEVTKSNTDDGGVEQAATFTAFEEAVAKAHATYDSRLINIEISDDFVFRAYYADGTVYESDVLQPTLSDGNVNMSKSWAVGGVGIRRGEDTDNAKYYSEESKSASVSAKKVYEESLELSNDMKMNANYTYFGVDFDTGELGYVSTNANFNINKETGELEQTRNEPYSPEQAIVENAKQQIDEYVDEMNLDSGADEDYVDEQIRNLRGDDSEKTVAGAYEVASGKLSMEDIAHIEDSIEHTFTEIRSYNFSASYPEGFSRDNCCVIGFMFREGDGYPWHHASGINEVSITAYVELRSDAIYVTFHSNFADTFKLQYRLVLFRMGLG